MMRMAERAMARRAASRIAAPATTATRRRRCRRRPRSAHRRQGAHRQQPDDLRGAARAVVRDEAGPAAVRTHPSGPFFALLVKDTDGDDRSTSSSKGTDVTVCSDELELELNGQRLNAILYCAIDQTVPGTKGGSVHVTAVAEGLAALGHEVHVLVTPGDGPLPARPGALDRDAAAARRVAAALGCGAVRSREIAERLRPDVIMERYYNFGGEGDPPLPRELRRAAVLEVNAPVIDHPGSPKALLDRALLVRPMQRWRERICAAADLIVTPSAAILPPGTPRDKDRRARMGRRHGALSPGAPGPAALHATAGRASRSSPARSAAGTARSTWRARSASCENADAHERRRAVHRRRAGAAGASGPKPPVSSTSSSPARCRTTGCRRAWPPPTSASRRSISARTSRWRSGSTGRR